MIGRCLFVISGVSDSVRMKSCGLNRDGAVKTLCEISGNDSGEIDSAELEDLLTVEVLNGDSWRFVCLSNTSER